MVFLTLTLVGENKNNIHKFKFLLYITSNHIKMKRTGQNDIDIKRLGMNIYKAKQFVTYLNMRTLKFRLQNAITRIAGNVETITMRIPN